MCPDSAKPDQDAPPEETVTGAIAEDDARARKANADSLRLQIQNLKDGRPPRSLNEFIQQKMAE